MSKLGRTARLPPYLWAQVLELIGVFGETRGEVLTFIITDWLGNNQTKINDARDRISKLEDKIKALSDEAGKQKRSKHRSGGKKVEPHKPDAG